jgi:sulfur relay (sulfurtransferase) complex TusBCD TusD component (DsrE family)
MMGELTILLTTGSMMTTGPYKALKLAEAALDRGHRVNLFCYGEGVTTLKRGQGPLNFPNVAELAEELIGRGMNAAACRTCCNARGYTPEDLITGAVYGGLKMQYVDWMKRSDRVVMVSY